MSSVQKLKEGDAITQEADTTNTVELMFFTNLGQVYKSRVAEFDDTKASVMGDYVASKLGMDTGEVPVYMALFTKYEGYMLFICLLMGVGDALVTFVNMEQMMFFYRLYYADWYLALYMLVNGLVYSSIGAWLGAKTGSKLQQVMGE